MATIIAGELNKNDIIEMSGVMKVMENDLHNIKSVEGLIEEIAEKYGHSTSLEILDTYHGIIGIIMEYCEVR